MTAFPLQEDRLSDINYPKGPYAQEEGHLAEGRPEEDSLEAEEDSRETEDSPEEETREEDHRAEDRQLEELTQQMQEDDHQTSYPEILQKSMKETEPKQKSSSPNGNSIAESTSTTPS